MVTKTPSLTYSWKSILLWLEIIGLPSIILGVVAVVVVMVMEGICQQSGRRKLKEGYEASSSNGLDHRAVCKFKGHPPSLHLLFMSFPFPHPSHGSRKPRSIFQDVGRILITRMSVLGLQFKSNHASVWSFIWLSMLSEPLKAVIPRFNLSQHRLGICHLYVTALQGRALRR